jgi:hypothetical protein
MRLRYYAYTIALMTAFQCGQVYKAHSYTPGLPVMTADERPIEVFEMASIPMNYYPPEYGENE